MRILVSTAALALITVLSSPVPQACGAIIAAGTTHFPVDTTLVAPDGEVDSITAQFFALPPYSGVLTSKVYLDDDNALGGYTFSYLLSNDVTSLDAIHRLTVNNFSGYIVDASYLTPTLDQAPGFVDRSPAGTIGFAFFDAPLGVGQLGAGETTALLILHTNAQTYAETLASVIDGRVSEVPSFAPAPVPEPAAALLFAMGGVTLAAAWWRRRARRA